MNIRTQQSVTLTRIRWARLLIILAQANQTTIVQELEADISAQVGLPVLDCVDGQQSESSTVVWDCVSTPLF